MRCSTIALLILCGTPSRTTRYPKQGECTAGVARGRAVHFPLLFGIAKENLAMKKAAPEGGCRDRVAVMSQWFRSQMTLAMPLAALATLAIIEFSCRYSRPLMVMRMSDASIRCAPSK